MEQIADTSRVTLIERGELDISKYYETIGSIAGTGRVLITTGRIIIGADNTSTTFLGEINAARGLAEDSPEASYRIVKVGKGELILASNNAPGLKTVVDGGRLVVNGVLNGTGVLVRGGRLSGTGTIRDDGAMKIKAAAEPSLLEVATNGNVAPGHDMGVLHADIAYLRGGTLIDSTERPAGGRRLLAARSVEPPGARRGAPRSRSRHVRAEERARASPSSISPAPMRSKARSPICPKAAR